MMTAQKKYEFEPDYAVPPGVTLQEIMESCGMTQKELATRTGLTEQSLTRIVKGEQPISYETANRLELVTQVPARLWNNLEAQYREQRAKLEERERLERILNGLRLFQPRSSFHLIRSQAEIISMADELGIAPGIIAGRYQFLAGKWNYYKGLIRKLEWNS